MHGSIIHTRHVFHVAFTINLRYYISKPFFRVIRHTHLKTFILLVRAIKPIQNWEHPKCTVLILLHSHLLSAHLNPSQSHEVKPPDPILRLSGVHFLKCFHINTPSSNQSVQKPTGLCLFKIIFCWGFNLKYSGKWSTGWSKTIHAFRVAVCRTMLGTITTAGGQAFINFPFEQTFVISLGIASWYSSFQRFPISMISKDEIKFNLQYYFLTHFQEKLVFIRCNPTCLRSIFQ